MKISIFLFATLFAISTAHSTLGEPKPIMSRVCRLGGTPKGSFLTCPGPCDLRTSDIKLRNATSPQNPAHIYRRGQLISIKYQRNNHGPGGFLRLSLVPLKKMMDKRAHAQNAFHYSCWGAVAVPAKSHEHAIDKAGFSLVGGDGKFHNLPVSYYEVKARIPAVVTDGDYALGWVWYGGLGGSIRANTPAHPYKVGHFSDYWACSFVRVQGGSALQSKSSPVFEGNLKKFWGDSCWSATNSPGICSYEPCKIPSKAQRPKEFQNGAKPKDLTPGNFNPQNDRETQDSLAVPLPTVVPDDVILQDALKALYHTKMDMWGKSRKTRGN